MRTPPSLSSIHDDGAANRFTVHGRLRCHHVHRQNSMIAIHAEVRPTQIAIAMHREERRYMVSSIASLLRLGWLESCQKPTMPAENANVSRIQRGQDCGRALLLRSTSHYDSEKPCQLLSVSILSKNPHFCPDFISSRNRNWSNPTSATCEPLL